MIQLPDVFERVVRKQLLLCSSAFASSQQYTGKRKRIFEREKGGGKRMHGEKEKSKKEAGRSCEYSQREIVPQPFLLPFSPPHHFHSLSHPTSDAVQDAVKQIDDGVRAIIAHVSAQLATVCAAGLEPAKTVPRQYRHTNKEVRVNLIYLSMCVCVCVCVLCPRS